MSRDSVDSILIEIKSSHHKISETIRRPVIIERVEEVIEVANLLKKGYSELPDTFKVAILNAIQEAFMAAHQRTALDQLTWSAWGEILQEIFSEEESELYLIAKQRCTDEYLRSFSEAYFGTNFVFQQEYGALKKDLDAVAMLDVEESETLNGAEEEKIAELPGQTKEEGKIQSSSMEKHGSLIQRLEKLSYLSEHLFQRHSSVGELERDFFENVFLDNMSAFNTLTRHSFKRDARIPSADLSEIQRKYEEFEDDEKKKKDILKLFSSTSSSDAYKLSESVGKCLGELAIDKESPKRTEALNTAADALVKHYIKTNLPHRALFISFQRLQEWETFPAILNPSRAEFFLHLLNTMNEELISATRKDDTRKTFILGDDLVYMNFFLGRYCSILRWSLLFSQWDEESKKWKSYMNEKSLKVSIQQLRLVVYTVVHFLHTYLYSKRLSFLSNEEQIRWKQTAIQHISTFFTETLVNVFSKSLLQDIYDFFDTQAVDGNLKPEDQLLLFTMEVEIKLMLTDVGSLLYPADRSSIFMDESLKRLQPLLDDVFDFIEENSSTLSSLQLTDVSMLANRILSCLSKLSGNSPMSKDTECFEYITKSFKKLLSFAALTKIDNVLHHARDLWEYFLFKDSSINKAPSAEVPPGCSTIVIPLLYADRSKGVSNITATVAEQEKRRVVKRSREEYENAPASNQT